MARSLPTDKLRVTYVCVNVGVYIIQAGIWIYLWIDDNSLVEFIGKIFIAVVSFMAALRFLLYGGKLKPLLKLRLQQSSWNRANNSSETVAAPRINKYQQPRLHLYIFR